MYTYYHNVETLDGSHSIGGVAIEDVWQEAAGLHAETGKGIKLTTVLMNDKEMVYQDEKPVEEEIVLIEEKKL